MTSRVISADTRLAQLEDCEHKILSACRRGLEATCSIAKELNKIYSQQLYELRRDRFEDYVTDCLSMDRRTCQRIINVGYTVGQLQEAGLALPANETQAAELARLEPERRASVWSGLLALEAKDPEKKLTTQDVKQAVEHEALATPPAPPTPPAKVQKSAGSIEVPMDNGEEPRQKEDATTVAGIVLTEKGEAALEHIRKVCGAQIAEGIETGNTALEEKDIRLWAEQEAALMRALVHYVTDKHWAVAKAIAFETKSIEDRTTVWHLIMMAKARGGRVSIDYDGTKITVETPI